MDKIPLNDSVAYAIARLVDDAQKDRRDPSHSEIEFQVRKFGLTEGDPNKDGQPVGKAKRVRAILNWGIENKIQSTEQFSAGLIALLRACGGFRPESPNYVGKDEILNLADSLKSVGVSLGLDGSIAPLALDGLTGKELTLALALYVNRAKKGIEDAALLVGTSKDLMEAVAAHVLQELWGFYPSQDNFPTLLGQAFTALGFATTVKPEVQGEHPRAAMERRMYELACSINKLRNKQGTGHGRPWISDLSQDEAKAAVEFIGVISERMLIELKKRKPVA